MPNQGQLICLGCPIPIYGWSRGDAYDVVWITLWPGTLRIDTCTRWTRILEGVIGNKSMSIAGQELEVDYRRQR
jgi:hypothetical protein